VEDGGVGRGVPLDVEAVGDCDAMVMLGQYEGVNEVGRIIENEILGSLVPRNNG
jgi:hypothetical protein